MESHEYLDSFVSFSNNKFNSKMVAWEAQKTTTPWGTGLTGCDIVMAAGANITKFR